MRRKTLMLITLLFTLLVPPAVATTVTYTLPRGVTAYSAPVWIDAKRFIVPVDISKSHRGLYLLPDKRYLVKWDETDHASKLHNVQYLKPNLAYAACGALNVAKLIETKQGLKLTDRHIAFRLSDLERKIHLDNNNLTTCGWGFTPKGIAYSILGTDGQHYTKPMELRNMAIIAMRDGVAVVGLHVKGGYNVTGICIDSFSRHHEFQGLKTHTDYDSEYVDLICWDSVSHIGAIAICHYASLMEHDLVYFKQTGTNVVRQRVPVLEDSQNMRQAVAPWNDIGIYQGKVLGTVVDDRETRRLYNGLWMWRPGLKRWIRPFRWARQVSALAVNARSGEVAYVLNRRHQPQLILVTSK